MMVDANEIMNELKQIHAKVSELDRARLAMASIEAQPMELMEFEPDKRIDELLNEVRALRAEFEKGQMRK